MPATPPSGAGSPAKALDEICAAGGIETSSPEKILLSKQAIVGFRAAEAFITRMLSTDYTGFECPDNYVDGLLNEGWAIADKYQGSTDPFDDRFVQSVGTKKRKEWMTWFYDNLTRGSFGFMMTNESRTNTYAVVSVDYKEKIYIRLFRPNGTQETEQATLQTFTRVEDVIGVLPKSPTQYHAYWFKSDRYALPK
ncbi:MAG: hypothetical protein KGR16_05580 [Verrucomicrobia bacterium]|nr:hypothetical protein [Verrucomicrobiota bacterium]MDE3047400.1 hypothetical protein [Verrucomicrobiota bacterium]